MPGVDLPDSVLLSGGGNIAGIETYVGNNPSEATVKAAVAAIIASGKPGTIYGSGTTTLTSKITVGSGVAIKGVPFMLNYDLANTLPDAGYSHVLGTTWEFVGDGTQSGGTNNEYTYNRDGTFDCFTYNETNTGAVSTPLTGFELENIQIRNFRHGVNIGAMDMAGLTHGRIYHVSAIGCAGWGFSFVNSCHTEFDRIYAEACLNGFLFGSYAVTLLSAMTGGVGGNNVTWFGGNCDFGTIYVITPSGTTNYLSRGIVFECQGASTYGQMNQVKVRGRLQVNRFNATSYSQSWTIASGSNSVTVPDSTKLRVGLPVSPTTTANGYTTNQTYVVKSITDATHITVADKITGTAITGSGSGAMTFVSQGSPCVEVISLSGPSISNCDFGWLDIEGASTAALYVENCFGSHFAVGQLPNTATNGAGIVLRNSQTNKLFSLNDAYIDADSNSNQSLFDGRAAGWRWASLGGQWIEGGAPTMAVGGHRLSFYGSKSWDFQKQGPSGGNLLLPNLFVAQSLKAATRSADWTIDYSHGQNYILRATGAATGTLPTITDTLVGTVWTFLNKGSAAAKIKTAAGQGYGGGSYLYVTLAAQAAGPPVVNAKVTLLAVKDDQGNYWWEAFLYPGATVTIS